MSFKDCTAIMCLEVPRHLNTKKTFEKHFGHFGPVFDAFCHPAWERAIVLFEEHTSAAIAKKYGTHLHGIRIVIYWYIRPGPYSHHRYDYWCAPVRSFDSQNRYRREGPPRQFKAFAAKVEVQVPPGVEFLTQVVPHMRAGFGLPPAETGEPRHLYGSSARPADAQQLFQPIPQPQPVRPPPTKPQPVRLPPPKPQLVYRNKDIMAELDCVIEEEVEAAEREVAAAGASNASTVLMENDVQMESLVSEFLGLTLQERPSTEIKLEQERVADEKRKLKEARQAMKCTEQVCTSLVEETLNADLEAKLQRKYIKLWRHVVAMRRLRRHCQQRKMIDFPAAPSSVHPRFKLQALVPSAPLQQSMADLARGRVNLGKFGTLSFSVTRSLKMREEVHRLMRVDYYNQKLLDERVWEPLDLPALATVNIPNPPDRIFWKAVLLLPSEHENVASLADRILCDWLKVKLGGRKESEEREEQLDGTLQTLCVTNTLRDEGQRTYRVHISVKASQGPLSKDSLSKTEECCELQGTRALIVLLPAMPTIEPGPDEQDVPLPSALLQLKQLQQASAWRCPLPLAILVPGPECGTGDTQKLEEALMLHTLVQEGLISEYTFFFIPETTSDLRGSKQLSQATRWLMARAPPPIQLSCQTLGQLV